MTKRRKVEGKGKRRHEVQEKEETEEKIERFRVGGGILVVCSVFALFCSPSPSFSCSPFHDEVVQQNRFTDDNEEREGREEKDKFTKLSEKHKDYANTCMQQI